MATYREVHCWESWDEETGEFDNVGYQLTRGHTCLLLDGHQGDHEFTPDSEIVVQFAAAGGVDGERDVDL